MSRFSTTVAALALALMTASVVAPIRDGLATAHGSPMILAVDPSPLVVETSSGKQTFSIEIADEDHERAAGLMFRTEMDDNRGMLFEFEQTRRLAFWMKNTPMSLDLVFIGEDGRVVAVLQGEPFSTTSIGPEAPARFVLELKAGTAQKAGIVDGVRLRHPRIDAVAD
jgi:uncharacterized membrane protein (UPF0127 family)